MAQNEIIITRGGERFWICTRNGSPKKFPADSVLDAVLKMQHDFPNDRVGVHVSVFDCAALEVFAQVVWIKKIEIKRKPN
jgi:hypothetical protein